MGAGRGRSETELCALVQRGNRTGLRYPGILGKKKFPIFTQNPRGPRFERHAKSLPGARLGFLESGKPLGVFGRARRGDAYEREFRQRRESERGDENDQSDHDDDQVILSRPATQFDRSRSY